MEKTFIPNSYEEWRHCITVECRLELTESFISERIAALQNPRDYSTKKFIQLYGQHHLQKVLGWFEQAKH
ncbi:hypothetical protein KFE80_12110 [bacterium SCSIO 12696]|nr:hypothetical protein KFE80_12110 [bacterium SCSIO 12696]